jgi:hypothetical protein
MAQKFSIAPVAKIDKLHLVGEKSTVTETMFWQTVESKVKELTADNSDKFDEVLQMVKATLLKAKTSLTVLDVCFEIKEKPLKKS